MKKFIDALRHPHFPQCRGDLVSEDGTSVCVLGLYLVQVKGWDPRELVNPGNWLFELDNELGPALFKRLVRWNDEENLTFAEIADRLDLDGA